MRLSISGLSKRFGPHVVLDRLSLELESIHRLVLIGPSGGGKTTLLRILAGLETPAAGEVHLDGTAMRFEEDALLRHRRSVGVVFQAFNLFPHLTALQNITLPLEKVHAYPPVKAREVAMQLLTRFQLASRAVAFKPSVLLFDEPTSALDPEMTAEVLDMIRELGAEGQNLILVTHEMGFARMVADRVAFLAQGRILECGTADQVFNEPKTEACRRFLAAVLKY